MTGAECRLLLCRDRHAVTGEQRGFEGKLLYIILQSDHQQKQMSHQGTHSMSTSIQNTPLYSQWDQRVRHEGRRRIGIKGHGDWM